MATKTKKVSKHWFFIGVLSALLGAPNAAIIRHTVADSNPFMFGMTRFGLVAGVCMPFFIYYVRRFNGKNLKYATLAGIYLGLGVTLFSLAIKYSQASYVSILTLITPILMVFFSARMIGERIKRRAVAGITLAAIGAMVIVVLPVAVEQKSEFVFYPLATAFGLLCCFATPLSTIYYRKANEGGIPFMPMMAYTSVIAVAINAIGYILFSTHEAALSVNDNIWSLLYSGLVVALLTRILYVASYEHVGAAATSALSYLQSLLAILIPVFFLGEHLSKEMVIGGILILIGVYVAEHHKSIHHKHFHLHFNR